jgi:predicted DNA-binding protein (MmcQ/YjbR family)
MPRTKQSTDAVLKELREFGLAYPGAHTKSPWPGHLDLAVKDKTFAYMSVAGEPLKISCKLPHSAEAALSLPFTTPTAYGLGKSGWVTATFPDGTPVPIELLREWIDESYRAQAPKRLSAGVPALGASADAESVSLSSPTPRRARSTVKQGAAASRPRPGAPARPAKRAPAQRAAAPRVTRKASPATSAKRAVDGERGTKRTPAGKRTAKKAAKRRASASAR